MTDVRFHTSDEQARRRRPRIADAVRERSRLVPPSYDPSPEEVEELCAYAERFAASLGTSANIIRTPEEIADVGIRYQIGKRQRIKGWYDVRTDQVNIYIPNIARMGAKSRGLLERTLLHEAVGHRGMMGLLGPARYEAYCEALWEKMSPRLREQFLGYVEGRPDSRADRIAAAAEYLAHTAENLESNDPGTAQAARLRWGFAMNVLSDSAPQMFLNAAARDNDLYQKLASALRRLRSIRRYGLPEEDRRTLSASVDRSLDALEMQLRGYEARNYNRVIKLGLPGNILLNSTPRTANVPVELRPLALFGARGDDKQERHPFSAKELHGLLDGLQEPLAVFHSKDRSKPDSIVVLLPNRHGDSHFVAVLTRTVNAEGFEVLNVDSVYPKPDVDVLRWVTAAHQDYEGNERPALLRYVSPEFERQYLAPARERIIRRYTDALLSKGGTEKIEPRDGKQQFDSAEVTGGLAYWEEARLLTVRAANVIKSFDNPLIPGEEFRIFQKKDSSLAQEMSALKERCIADGSFMLAPDGTRSTLSEDEWLFARSSAFRNAYGDWEGHLLDEEVKEKGFTPAAQRLLGAEMTYHELTGEDVLGRLPAWNLPSLKIEKDLLSLHKVENEDGESEILSKRRAQSLVREDGRGNCLDVEAALVARGCGSTDSQNSPADRYDEEVDLGKRQELVLEQWARARGLWREQIDTSPKAVYGSKVDEGAEADVWYDASCDEAVKLLNLSYFISPQLALDRILIHNRIAPQAPLHIEALGRDGDGGFRILARQPWIRGEATTQEETDELIRSWGQGFRKIGGDDSTEYASDSLYIGDLHGANVLKTPSGECVIIDIEARLNTPGLGFGGKYIIPSREKKFNLSSQKEPNASDIQRIAYSLGLTDNLKDIYFSKERTEKTESNLTETNKNTNDMATKKITPYETLVNDIATEMAVGGDRFTPWNIAPLIAEHVGSIDKMEDFRKDIIRKYESSIPDYVRADKEFAQKEIEIWASDQRFREGEVANKIKKEPDRISLDDYLVEITTGLYKAYDAGVSPLTLYNSEGKEIARIQREYQLEGNILKGKDLEGRPIEIDAAEGKVIEVDAKERRRKEAIATEKMNIYAGTGENAELSNFARRPFSMEKDGPLFVSVEQYFQYRKVDYAKVSENDRKQLREAILGTTDGANLKLLGKSIPGLDTQEWNKVSYDVMRDAVRASFVQNPEALDLLLSTEGKILTHTQDKGRWGKDFPAILMEVRNEILAERRARKEQTEEKEVRSAEKRQAAAVRGRADERGPVHETKGEIFSLGKGARSWKDFSAMHPKGFDMVFDLSEPLVLYKASRELAPSSLRNLYGEWAKAAGRDIEYINAPELSGEAYVPEEKVTKAYEALLADEKQYAKAKASYDDYVKRSGGSARVSEAGYIRQGIRMEMKSAIIKNILHNDDERRNVVDYKKYIDGQPGCRATLERIAKAVEDGKRVLIVGPETYPVRSVVMRLAGQEMLRRGIEMKHIAVSKDGVVSTVTQREAMAAALGNYEVVKGEMTGIHFRSDGTKSLAPGTKLDRKEHRMMEAMRTGDYNEKTANYGTEVEFRPAEGNSEVASAISALDMADLTVWATGQYSAVDGRIIDIAKKANVVQLSIPEMKYDQTTVASYERTESHFEKIALGDASAEHVYLRAKAIAQSNGERFIRVSYTNAEGEVVSARVPLWRRTITGGVHSRPDGSTVSAPKEIVYRDIAPEDVLIDLRSIADEAGVTAVDVEVFGEPERVERTYERGLLDDAKIEKDAEALAKAVAKKATVNALEGKGDAVTLFMGGSNIAHITTKKVEGMVGAAELSGRSRALLATEGMKMDDQVEITEGDVQKYFTRLLDLTRQKLAESGSGRIGAVVVTGESGAARAAGKASQYHYLKTTVIPTANWMSTYDNETPFGIIAGGRANEIAIRNDFYQGLRAELSESTLEERNVRRDFAYRDENLHVEPGLTPVQVLTLQQLGFSNEDIVFAVAEAREQGLRFAGKEDFSDYVRSADHDGAELIGDDMVSLAYDKAEALVKEARSKGIFPVVEGGPFYPDSLLEIKPYRRYDSQTSVVVEDGMAKTVTVEQHEDRLHPAILWDKGDADILLSSPAVSFVGGGRWSEPDATTKARALADACLERGIIGVFTDIRGPQRAAMDRMIDNQGKVVLITRRGVDDPQISGFVERIERNGGRIISLGTPGTETLGGDRRTVDALAAAITGNVVAMDGITQEGSIDDALTMVSGYVSGEVRTFGADAQETAKELFFDAIAGTSAAERNHSVEVRMAEARKEIAEEVSHPAAYTFPVLHYGKRTLFVVDEKYPDVREAILKDFGPDAEIISRFQRNAVERRLKYGAISFGGGSISILTDADFTRTGIQRTEPHVTYMVYHKNEHEGKHISSMLRAPEGSVRLNAALRKYNFNRFGELREAVAADMKELQKQAGYEGSRNLAFASATYAVVHPSSIDIYMHGEKQAQVYLDFNGQMAVNNITPGFLPKKRAASGEKALKEIRDVIHARLFDRDPALAERDDLEKGVLYRRDVDQGPDQVYYGRDPKEAARDGLTNVDIARLDIEDALKAKALSLGDGEPFDVNTAVTVLEAKIAGIRAEIKKQEKKTAVAEDISEKMKQDWDQKVVRGEPWKKQDAAMKAYNESRDALGAAQADLGRLYRDLALAKESLAMVKGAGSLTIEPDGRTLGVDGITVTLPSDWKEMVAKASKQEKKDSEAEQQAPEAKTEDYSIVEGKRSPGIVRRADGKMAYARIDEGKIQVISGWHDNVKPMDTLFGMVEDTKGSSAEVYLVSRKDPAKVIGPFDGVANPSEGFAVVKRGGEFNHLDLKASAAAGEPVFLSPLWSASTTSMLNGWAAIQAGEADIAAEKENGRDISGLSNYINTKGELLTEEWYVEAKPFAPNEKGELYAAVKIHDANGKLRSLSLNPEGLTAEGKTAKEALRALNQAQTRGMGGPK